MNVLFENEVWMFNTCNNNFQVVLERQLVKKGLD